LRDDRSTAARASAAPEQGPSVTQDDAEAFSRRYRLPLLRFFQRRLHNRADAEDLAHEVLLRLARQRARNPRPAYIFLAARSVLLDKVRKDRLRQRFAGDSHTLDENVIAVPSAERVYSARERVKRISELIEGLTPRAREVFVMHRIDGMAYSEIAQALGIAVSTVEKHMISALRYLVQHADEVR
jgi:RNA polymerase sigma factor (sigma-70 family)